MSDWLERGLVGRPKYDPRTHEIRADPVVTSDVTRQVWVFLFNKTCFSGPSK